MFRLWTSTKYAGAFVGAMEAIIQNETVRVTSEPPQEEVALVETLKKTMADVDHEYLSRLARKSKPGRVPKPGSPRCSSGYAGSGQLIRRCACGRP